MGGRDARNNNSEKISGETTGTIAKNAALHEHITNIAVFRQVIRVLNIVKMPVEHWTKMDQILGINLSYRRKRVTDGYFCSACSAHQTINSPNEPTSGSICDI